MTAYSASAHKTSARLRTRWQHFRLDMTPMVDVAFLLLTFLLLHVAMARARVIQLMMPDTRKQTSDERYMSCHSGRIMSIMLGRNHRLHYYYGLNAPLDPSLAAPELKTTDFSVQGIRRVLLATAKLRKIVILIKPTPDATYKDVVDILDEMTITDQSRYALVKIPAADTKLLQKAGY